MKTLKISMMLSCLVVLALGATGCITGRSHTSSQCDYIDGNTLRHKDTDWTISSPLNLPVEMAQTSIQIVKQVGEDVVGTSCEIGTAVLVSAANPPQFYVYDGYENIGWINGRMVYSYDGTTWDFAPPIIMNRFYSYSRSNPDWYNHRYMNLNYSRSYGGGYPSGNPPYQQRPSRQSGHYHR